MTSSLGYRLVELGYQRMKCNIIYKQPYKEGHSIWLIEAEDQGYAAEVAGCMIRGLSDGESLEVHAYLSSDA